MFLLEGRNVVVQIRTPKGLGNTFHMHNVFTINPFSPTMLTHFIGHYGAPIHMFRDTQLPYLYVVNPNEGNNVCIDICFYFLVCNT